VTSPKTPNYSRLKLPAAEDDSNLCLGQTLKVWRDYTKYSKAEDWVFAAQRRVGKGLIGDSV